jgi:penicillin-insensitive murein endopeptidase
MKGRTLIKRLKLFFYIILIASFLWASPVIFYWNKGKSTSTGHVVNGKLINAYKLDLYGNNYSYFSYFSYYMLGMCFTNSSVYQCLKDAMKTLEVSCPNRHFYIMELSRIYGGKSLLHQTHRNGMSVDLMVPKINKNNKPCYFYDHAGLFHYLNEFDSDGHLKLDKSVKIDFDALAELIFAVQKAASENGLKISQIIIRDEIKDNLAKTATGSKIAYLMRSYPNNKFVNKMHDDHIHVDFTYN